MMRYEDAKTALTAAGQEHVLAFWHQLSEAEQSALLAQIATLDFAEINRMQGILASAATADSAAADFEPAAVEVLEGDERTSYFGQGEAELRAGHVAALLVAGGQGSRLGFDGPKGSYPIGPITDQSLFYFHARKILAMDRIYQTRIPFYIMTSETNDAATRAHFAENGYFGLPQEDVFFFVQGMWPALTPDGKIILDTPGHIFMSPDGHGGTIAALQASGALADMAKRGITSVFFFQVDNPMVNIAAPAFIGLHTAKGADMSLKVCPKRDPREGMGIVVKRAGQFAMVEYSELTPEQMDRRLPDGKLWLNYGSPAIHLFSYDFLKREAAIDMPLHLAHKKIATVAPDGSIVKADAPNGYKFEKFIFDVLPDAKTLINQEFDRFDEFSPVKNAEGSDSPATTKADLQRKWAKWFAAAGQPLPCDETGKPTIAVEIDPCYAWNAETFIARGPVETAGLTQILLQDQ